MKNSSSISLKSTLRKIITAFGLILSAVLILLAVAYAWVIEDNIFNRWVLAEAAYIESHYDQTSQVSQPRSPFMKLESSWEALPEIIQQLHNEDSARVEFPTPDGKTLHIREIYMGGKLFVLTADVSAFEVSRDYLPKLVPWFLILMIVVAILAFILTQYLIKKIVSPIEYVTKQIKDHDQQHRFVFDRSIPNNEIGYLAQHIKDNINQLQDTLSRESNFTRDISHELRTPTTILKMIINRLSVGHQLDHTTLEKLTHPITEIEQTLNTLLALAREESIYKSPINVLEEIEICLINNKEVADAQDLQLIIDIPRDMTVTANQNLFQIMINNLIQNALRHSSEPALKIIMKDNTLVVSNPSVEPTISELFEPGNKGVDSKGLGQGLNLVKRICDVSQWTLSSHYQDNEFHVYVQFSP